MDGVRFAYRYCQIVPQQTSAAGPRSPHSSDDPPMSPNKWKRQGFSRPWYRWRSNQMLSDQQVTPRKAFSVVWCQRTQTYWVVDGDCTNADDLARIEQWDPLACQNLATDIQKPREGLWRLTEYGPLLQHDSTCPVGFDEILPKNFFLDQNTKPCHFFGHLSLILALLAMCPEQITDIPRQIDALYLGNKPLYLPCAEHKFWKPMSKTATPGRALVMQTGIINDPDGTADNRIREWENGVHGPMISSHQPTAEELNRWGVN